MESFLWIVLKEKWCLHRKGNSQRGTQQLEKIRREGRIQKLWSPIYSKIAGYKRNQKLLHPLCTRKQQQRLRFEKKKRGLTEWAEQNVKVDTLAWLKMYNVILFWCLHLHLFPSYYWNMNICTFRMTPLLLNKSCFCEKRNTKEILQWL